MNIMINLFNIEALTGGLYFNICLGRHANVISYITIC